MTRKKRSKSKKLRNILLMAGFAVGMLLIAAVVFSGNLVYKANSAIHRIAAPADVPADLKTGISHQEANKEKEIAPVIFLLAGVDSREGSEGSVNTDVLMLASFNPETHSASLLSLPRDLLLKPQNLPHRKANFYYAYYYARDKTTAMANTQRLFSDLFQLPIDYMAVVDFDALRRIVDAVGGLDIDVDMDMKYVDNADGTRIDLKKGIQKLGGQQVLDFVRYRKSNRGTRESSDFARNERQQEVIRQIAEKLGKFQGMTQWGRVLDIIGGNVQTNVPEPVLRQWIFNFNRMKPDQIRSLYMDPVWKSPYVYVKEEDLTQALAALRSEAGLSAVNLHDIGNIVGVE